VIHTGMRNARDGVEANSRPLALCIPRAAMAWRGCRTEETAMISNDTVYQIKRLLALGTLSQREIAQRTGVGRTSVSSVASGQWDDRLAPSDSDDEWLPHQMLPAVRCPTCGGRVHPPCLLCHVRTLQEKKRRPCEKAQSAAS
jgi:hypothetical protein